MTAIKHALQRDIFTPNDERLLCIVNVCKAGKKKKNCFLCATGRQACSPLRQRSGSIKQCCVCEILLPPFHQSHHRETCPGESGEGEEIWQGGFLQTAADMGAPRSDRSGCQRCQQGQKTVCALSYLTATLWVWSWTSFAKCLFFFLVATSRLFSFPVLSLQMWFASFKGEGRMKAEHQELHFKLSKNSRLNPICPLH